MCLVQNGTGMKGLSKWLSTVRRPTGPKQRGAEGGLRRPPHKICLLPLHQRGKLQALPLLQQEAIGEAEPHRPGSSSSSKMSFAHLLLEESQRPQIWTLPLCSKQRGKRTKQLTQPLIHEQMKALMLEDSLNDLSGVAFFRAGELRQRRAGFAPASGGLRSGAPNEAVRAPTATATAAMAT